MNILAIDTSTNILSIALQSDSGYEERLVDISSFSHSEDLLPEIESLLSRVSLDISALNLIVVAKGPGSFTGLRIGMASAKGIASALSIPVVSIPTLDAIAEEVSFYQGYVIAVIDAKRKKYYLQVTEKGETVIAAKDGSREDVEAYLSKSNPPLITGPDAEAFASQLEEGTYILDKNPRNIARALIRLGLERMEKAGSDDIGEGPVYIRRSDAEEALLRKIEEKSHEKL